MAAAVSKDAKKMESVKHKNLQTEVEFAECDCCGLTEECTPAYIARVREKFEGRWLCGLCSEAVKDETVRSEEDITTNEALDRHLKFCEQFKSSSPPANPAEDLISAMKHLLRRTLDSPRKSGPPSASFVRSKSCFSTLSNGEVRSEV
ncbi:uncharacterized protein LOC110410942 [Herrania umbratica]|uniref:Uncharacterized protein LOC110410942 n=1 Tax=Herrania umbratica TaxID=108875 RepID=A0A6J0ZNZ8_9ROSI|nr:uncharacterized protein LOC110410942 [Herrania umbratica]XP_021276569.1 uncharacterized protein LOC110410942 [Herrania umbratica]XP_021276570.1 uncharacterized protein LOC110410942 [Herrania umbratica]XP_021276573.1 uncharacterized protein LOC110410942 [Herrania umbratica]